MLSYISSIFTTEEFEKELQVPTLDPIRINSSPEHLEQEPEPEIMKRDINFDELKEELLLLRKRVQQLKIEQKEIEEREQEQEQAKQFLFFNYVLGLHDTIFNPISQCFDNALDSFDLFLKNELNIYVEKQGENKENIENENENIENENIENENENIENEEILIKK